MIADKNLNSLLQRHPHLTECIDALQQAFHILFNAFQSGHKLLLCGNGGSAADCEHWAGELLKSFCAPRQVQKELQQKLPPGLAGKLQGGLPAIPLTGFISASTAFANDVDPQLIFAQLVCALGQPGDVLVGLSTSGNSKNVIAAFQVARAKGMKTIALTGRSGGALAPLADVAIKAPAHETFEVQELHLPLYHTLCLMLEDALFG